MSTAYELLSADDEPITCCITLEEVVSPAGITSAGSAYNYVAISAWLVTHSKDPLTGLHVSSLVSFKFTRNYELKAKCTEMRDSRLCVLTRRELTSPVAMTPMGNAYNVEAFREWLMERDTDPISGVLLPKTDPFAIFTYNSRPALDAKREALQLKHACAATSATEIAAVSPRKDLLFKVHELLILINRIDNKHLYDEYVEQLSLVYRRKLLFSIANASYDELQSPRFYAEMNEARADMLRALGLQAAGRDALFSHLLVGVQLDAADLQPAGALTAFTAARFKGFSLSGATITGTFVGKDFSDTMWVGTVFGGPKQSADFVGCTFRGENTTFQGSSRSGKSFCLFKDNIVEIGDTWVISRTEKESWAEFKRRGLPL